MAFPFTSSHSLTDRPSGYLADADACRYSLGRTSNRVASLGMTSDGGPRIGPDQSQPDTRRPVLRSVVCAVMSFSPASVLVG